MDDDFLIGVREHLRHLGLYVLLVSALFLTGDPWLAFAVVLAVIVTDVW